MAHNKNDRTKKPEPLSFKNLGLELICYYRITAYPGVIEVSLAIYGAGRRDDPRGIKGDRIRRVGLDQVEVCGL